MADDIKYEGNIDLGGCTIKNGGFERFTAIPSTFKGDNIIFGDMVWTWSGSKYVPASVGGTNLVKRSNIPTTNNNYLINIYYYGNPALINVGDIMTIQIKGELGNGKSHFGVFESGGVVGLSFLTTANRNEKGIYTNTFRFKTVNGPYTSNKTGIYIYVYDSSVVVDSTIEWVKLEKGRIATDWSPAPEDKLDTDFIIPANNNYLPKIDATNRKLVVSKLLDNGTTLKYNDKEVATTDHSHTEYALTEHTHSGYAPTDHSHSGYAPTSHTHTEYAPTDHSHTEYAPTSHTHTEYAPTDHSHTEYAPTSHNHNYDDMGNLPAIYNAIHKAVPDTNFNNLFAYNSDIWCCRDTMTNAPKDRGCIDTNSDNTNGHANNIIIQYGNIGSGQQTQMLLITNQNNGIYKVGDIFTRTKEGDNISLWQKILVFEDYNNLKNDINYLANSINNVSSRKQDKQTEVNITINANATYNILNNTNVTYNITLSGINAWHTINLPSPAVNSLEEINIIINNPNNASRVAMGNTSLYKKAGIIPDFSFRSSVITIWKGIIFANELL